MEYSKNIESVKKRIEELNHIKELLYNIEDTVYSIEREISTLDNALPNDREVRQMKAGAEKDQLLHLLDLLTQSYSIIDEILGPPEDQAAGGIDEILNHFPSPGRGSAS